MGKGRCPWVWSLTRAVSFIGVAFRDPDISSVSNGEDSVLLQKVFLKAMT